MVHIRQKSGQLQVSGIRLETHLIDDGQRGCVGQDIVYLIFVGGEVFPGLLVFRLAWQLLLPIGDVLLPEPTVNAVGPAHGEKGLSPNGINLPPDQMDDILSDSVDPASIPHFLGIGINRRKILMVAIHKAEAERLFLQIVQKVFLWNL